MFFVTLMYTKIYLNLALNFQRITSIILRVIVLKQMKGQSSNVLSFSSWEKQALKNQASTGLEHPCPNYSTPQLVRTLWLVN